MQFGTNCAIKVQLYEYRHSYQQEDEIFSVYSVQYINRSDSAAAGQVGLTDLKEFCMQPKELRKEIANGTFTGQTAGECSGFVQANLVVLPEEYATDFEEFCRRNPKPCPLLEKVGPGSHLTTTIADSANLLDTIPGYLVWENGQIVDQAANIRRYSRDNLVFFLLGCSFSFEQALIDADIPLRHILEGKNVAMYNTSIDLEPAGPFHGKMVVSMRPVQHRQVARACAITAHFPDVHGEPVQVGYPEMIGIAALDRPDYGEAVAILPGEIPLFWACGVTPQNVLRQARLPFAITHAPGHMFVGDLRNDHFARCSLRA